MFHQIGRGPSRKDSDRGVVERLSECHDRIRRSVAIAVRLGAGGGEGDAPDDDVRAAAQAVIGYFSRSLGHHSADEDDSIAPRLAGHPELDDVLVAIADQHRQIHETLDGALALWQRVADDPGRRSALAGELTAVARRLEAQFDEHLGLEETRLFPAVAALPTDIQDAIVAEMIGRRQTVA